MKRRIQIIVRLLGLAIGLALVGQLAGCQRSQGPSGPDPAADPPPTIGGVHTEVLTEIYANLDGARAAQGPLDRAAKDATIIAAVNAITDRHGCERMSPEAILLHVERGRQLAQQDLIPMVADLLGPAEQVWWDRFSSEAELGDAREIYMQHCRRYGAPACDSQLGQILDLNLSSAEFWWAYRGDQKPSYQNPYLPLARPSWRERLLRFSVGVLVDGVAGGLAGASGGPVAAGIIGGLASYGADSLLFGG